MSSATISDDTANVGSASQLVAIQLGLDQTPSNQWTDAQRTAFAQAFAQTILTYPDSFTDATIAEAQAVQSANLSMLQSPSGGGLWQTIGSGVGTTLAQFWDYNFGGLAVGLSSVASVGTAVLASFSATASVVQQLAQLPGNLAAAAANVTSVLTWALPLAVIIFLYFAARSAGKDPGGQFAKGAKGAGDAAKSVGGGVAAFL